jgi:hypothetical protein
MAVATATATRRPVHKALCGGRAWCISFFV